MRVPSRGIIVYLASANRVLDGHPPPVAWRRWLVDGRAVSPPTGDHEGPHHIHSATLAPTEYQIRAKPGSSDNVLSAVQKMNFLSFLFVILCIAVKRSLEVLDSCLMGIHMLHFLQEVTTF